TIIMRMGKPKYALITLVPLAWLVIVTMSAGYAKLFSPLPKLGFLAHARVPREAQAAGTLPAGVKTPAALAQMIANDYLDAAVAAFFLIAVIIILADSARAWWSVLQGRSTMKSSEVPFTERLPVAGD